jgi:hypothetical protein
MIFMYCTTCSRLLLVVYVYNFNFQTGFNEIKDDHYVIYGFTKRMIF